MRNVRQGSDFAAAPGFDSSLARLNRFPLWSPRRFAGDKHDGIIRGRMDSTSMEQIRSCIDPDDAGPPA
jgi:hypothetical protein